MGGKKAQGSWQGERSWQGKKSWQYAEIGNRYFVISKRHAILISEQGIKNAEVRRERTEKQEGNTGLNMEKAKILDFQTPPSFFKGGGLGGVGPIQTTTCDGSEVVIRKNFFYALFCPADHADVRRWMN